MQIVKMIAVAFILLAIGLGVTSVTALIGTIQLKANLSLADDASTPEKKGEFLRKFLADVERADLAEYAAWIVKDERSRMLNQIEVVQSLIQRCDETAALDRSTMGYSQGMTQITGQEFDHAINSVGEVFTKAYYVERGWIMVYGWVVAFIIGVILALVGWHEELIL